jgi:uncharacterized protein YbjT (DUF2867 family)
MKVVAVAGGTGSVGSTIVDGLVEYGKHKIYALSRNVRLSPCTWFTTMRLIYHL